jgi:hypothetical protein
MKYNKEVTILACLLMFPFFIGAPTNRLSLEKVKISTPDTIVDSVNDIIRYDTVTETCENTTLYVELDIDSLVRSGQEFTITMHSNFRSESNYIYTLSIRNGTEIYYTFVQEGYVILMKEGVGLWDGSEWSETGTPLVIGAVSGDTMSFEIPIEVITISNTLLWAFTAIYDDVLDSGFQYMDGAPNSAIETYCETGGDIQDIIDDIPGGGDTDGGGGEQDDEPSIIDYDAENDVERWEGLYEIPGIEFPIIICWLIGIGIALIILNRRKLKII